MRFAVLILAPIALCGCWIGPKTVQRDRMDYIAAVSDSLKTQMLYNLVKLRYGDVPVFMDVSSIINQYLVQGSVNASGSWTDSPFSTTTTLGGIGTYAERPTISYTPLTGDKFTRSLLTPIPPSAVLNFLQAGRSPDLLLHTAVQSMNGIQNAGASTLPDPRFERIVQLMTKMQQAGGVVIRFGEGKDKGTTYLVVTNIDDPNVSAERAELRRILRLDPDATEISVVYGASPANDRQVAIVTRSVFDIMAQVALSAEVPQKDIDEGRTTPSSPLLQNPAFKPLARIRCGKLRPQDAAIAVRYRNLWFWVDDKDLASKRMFTMLLLMVNLAEAGTPSNAPLITIPAG
jgi:hypothetical protein